VEKKVLRVFQGGVRSVCAALGWPKHTRGCGRAEQEKRRPLLLFSFFRECWSSMRTQPFFLLCGACVPPTFPAPTMATETDAHGLQRVVIKGPQVRKR
jgi:hypothetical protein